MARRRTRPWGLTLAVLHIFALCCSAQPPPPPRIMPWVNAHFGPDGPWYAVDFRFDGGNFPVALIPGGIYQPSLIPSKEVCSKPEFNSTPEAPWNPCARNTSLLAYDAKPASVIRGLDGERTSGSRDRKIDPVKGLLYGYGEGKAHKEDVFIAQSFDSGVPGKGDTLGNFSFFSLTGSYRFNFQGNREPMGIGTLTLGSRDLPDDDNMKKYGIRGLAGIFKEAGMTPSNSFGMHLGSTVNAHIEPSLVMGGYDRRRIVGPVSAQKATQRTLAIDLLDIKIGVAAGGSPFRSKIKEKTGLFSSARNLTQPKAALVEVNPLESYMYLPKATCDIIAAELPVNYDGTLGMYIWNTTDPQFERIVNSPAYLGFTFVANASANQNMTINVPFRLLNLTLESPRVNNTVQYFPCNVQTEGNANAIPRRVLLGRAFLQAAFIGVNWDVEANDKVGEWFLAQAPGPGIIPSTPAPQAIAHEMRSLEPGEQTWLDTWKAAWTPLPEDPSSEGKGGADGDGAGGTGSDTESKSDKASMSTGTIVGVSVAIAVVVAGAVVTSVLFVSRRRRRTAAEAPGNVPEIDGTARKFSHGSSCGELDGGEKAAELGQQREPGELSTSERPGELSTSSEGGFQELDASVNTDAPVTVVQADPVELDASVWTEAPRRARPRSKMLPEEVKHKYENT